MEEISIDKKEDDIKEDSTEDDECKD